MDEANLNPYQSPQVFDPNDSKSLEQAALTMAELQARVLELERRVNASWFLGSFWKRPFAVYGHLLLGYVVIVAVAYGVGAIIVGILILLGVVNDWSVLN
jgi:hypothetical protein